MSDKLLTDQDRRRIAETRRRLAEGLSPESFTRHSDLTARQGIKVTAENRAKMAVEQQQRDAAKVKREGRWTGKITIREVQKVISVVKLPPQLKEENVVRCVKCGVEVNPGMSHVARVYKGHINVPVDKARLVSVNPDVQYEEFTEKLPVAKFATGHVCDTCAAEYRYVTVETRKGFEEIPLVVTQPRGVMQPPIERTMPNRRGFSTRMRVRGAVKAHYKDNYFTD